MDGHATDCGRNIDGVFCIELHCIVLEHRIAWHGREILHFFDIYRGRGETA